jgi:hypothetical protein
MSPKLSYILSESSNLYSFVSDLSNWNSSVFPLRRKEWIRRTGKLTRKDSEMLKRFGAIHAASDPLLFLLFFDPHHADPLRALDKKIGKKKTSEIREILEYFHVRFYKLWPTEKAKLERMRKMLMREKIGEKSTVKSIMRLCGVKKIKDEQIFCYLNMSASSVPDCNGWTSDNVIVLECSGWPMRQFREIHREIIPHELFHILLRDNKRLLQNVRRIAAANESPLSKINFEHWSSRMVFEEIVISSFIPEGYLIHARPNRPKGKPRDFQSVRKRFAYLLRAQAMQYVTSQKAIDPHYLNGVMDQINPPIPSYLTKIAKVLLL